MDVAEILLNSSIYTAVKMWIRRREAGGRIVDDMADTRKNGCYPQSVSLISTAERFQQIVNVPRNIVVLSSQICDLATGVQNRGVIAAAEGFTDIGQA